MVYKTPKHVQERKDAKRRLILDTAARVFAARGYHGTTVKDVVDEAGISVGSFYFYFSNKEELFETLYDEMNDIFLSVIEDAVNGDQDDTSRSVCKAITLALWYFQNSRELARIMLIEAVGLNARFEEKRAANNRRYCKILEDIFHVMSEKGIISVPDVQVAAIAFMGAVYTLIIDWLQREQGATLVESSYPLVVYSMQALKMKFDDMEVKSYIDSILKQDYESMMEGIKEDEKSN